MSTHVSTQRRMDPRRGFALPMVIIMLIVAMLSCGAYLAVAFQEYNQSVREEHHEQALYLAEAGLQRTLHAAGATSNLGSLDDHTDVKLGPGTYTVNVSSASGGGVVIRSTGKVMDRSRTIQLHINRN